MNEPKLLLNLGCGNSFHPAWRNLDLVPQSSQVEAADLSQGIPCEDNSADAVYHSHLLEHLTQTSAREFVADCFRVLRPGGIIRIAVPDLEQIAIQYLKTVDAAWDDPSEIHLANHYWMQLELLDQVVRHQSGGEMGKFMTDPTVPNEEFIRNRLGNEVGTAQSKSGDGEPPVQQRPGFFARLAAKIKRKVLRLLLGKGFEQKIAAIEFRNSGEIHQWMYDRVSLRKLLQEAGFTDFQVCNSVTSKIDGFAGFELDAAGKETRKPDSIFVEARKPSQAQGMAA